MASLGRGISLGGKNPQNKGFQPILENYYGRQSKLEEAQVKAAKKLELNPNDFRINDPTLYPYYAEQIRKTQEGFIKDYYANDQKVDYEKLAAYQNEVQRLRGNNLNARDTYAKKIKGELVPNEDAVTAFLSKSNPTEEDRIAANDIVLGVQIDEKGNFGAMTYSPVDFNKDIGEKYSKGKILTKSSFKQTPGMGTSGVVTEEYNVPDEQKQIAREEILTNHNYRANFIMQNRDWLENNYPKYKDPNPQIRESALEQAVVAKIPDYIKPTFVYKQDRKSFAPQPRAERESDKVQRVIPQTEKQITFTSELQNPKTGEPAYVAAEGDIPTYDKGKAKKDADGNPIIATQDRLMNVTNYYEFGTPINKQIATKKVFDLTTGKEISLTSNSKIDFSGKGTFPYTLDSSGNRILVDVGNEKKLKKAGKLKYGEFAIGRLSDTGVLGGKKGDISLAVDYTEGLRNSIERSDKNPKGEVILESSQAEQKQNSSGGAKTVAKKQYSKSANKTKIIYSDGTEEIVDGQQ